MTDRPKPLHVSLLATPDVMASSLSGLYEILNAFRLFGSFDDSLPEHPPFVAEVVASGPDALRAASGLPLGAQRRLDEVEHTDIVILPQVLVAERNWTPGRYPEVVEWLKRVHGRGGQLCSACSGVLLLAETGLLDGLETTLHWAYAPTFRRNFPKVNLRLQEVLVVTGKRQEFVMSGASGSWQDLALYLITRHVGPAAAQALAKFMLLQWHKDGQAPYVTFNAVSDHGDAVILRAQDWLRTNYTSEKPVEEMVRRSGIPERSFKRRFTKATGHAPISYVQHVRIEEAKRRLERSDMPIDEIGWAVGYQEPAFFRRLFKRTTRLTPGEYRRKFRLPELPSALAS